MELTTDREMLADVQKAIRAVMVLGQSYTLQGSRTVTKANLSELLKIEQFYRRRLSRKRGSTGKSSPDFRQRGGDSSAGEPWEFLD